MAAFLDISTLEERSLSGRSTLRGLQRFVELFRYWIPLVLHTLLKQET